MVTEDTLKIKNFPKEITDSEKEELLKHFGASKVKIITSNAKQKSVVYARFEAKEIAREVLFRLHQTFILKSRLCVEYADQDVGLSAIKKEDTSATLKDHFKTFITKLNSFNHSVDFQQPPPAHLKYVYPKANRATINNVGHALATVPKFYTQVLHLMNRMNLPPPFVLDPPQKQIMQNKPPEPLSKPPKSSSESELESDEESRQNKEVIPVKRKFHQKKIVKRPKFFKNAQGTPSTNKGEKPEDVFDASEVQAQRKIEMIVSTSALETKPMDTSYTVVGVIGNWEDSEENPEEIEVKTVITAAELNANQIPAKDLKILPVFKNYHPGVPTNRLYIKNLAKTVELKDLEYIFNRYRNEGEEFDIRLMQEGRMKGQAFITLNNKEVAQMALKETNAYILKDKPLVVAFAKSAPVKK